MGAVLNLQVQFAVEVCCNCHLQFAMPIEMQKRLGSGGDKFGEMFYCPSGHPQRYTGPSEAQRLKSQLEQRDRQLALAKSETEIQRRIRGDVERDRDHQAAKRLKAEKKLARAKNGVCPCCKRSFTALRRHMATKHPGFKP